MSAMASASASRSEPRPQAEFERAASLMDVDSHHDIAAPEANADVDDDVAEISKEAGTSAVSSVDHSLTIASTGLEFWEYRRACFLAGAPFPSIFSGPHPTSSRGSPTSSAPSSSSSLPPTSLPEIYIVPPPPPPAPSVPYAPSPNSAVGRLESLLADFSPPSSPSESGQHRDPSTIAWNGGLGGVHRNLTGSKRLARGLRLGLVIRILRAGWVRDGTWPIDKAGRAVDPPSSPEPTPAALPDIGEGDPGASGSVSRYPPLHENRKPRCVGPRTIRGPRRRTQPDTISYRPPAPKSVPKAQSSFGSRLAALIPSSLLSSASGSSSSASGGWYGGGGATTASAVNAGTDSPVPASPLLPDGTSAPTPRQLPVGRGRGLSNRLERV